MSDDTLTLDGYGAINWHGQPRILAHRDPMMGDIIELRLGVDTPQGSRYVARPVVMAKHEPGRPIAPMVSLDMGTAQMLMDELWRCGLRPTEGTGSAGALAATQAHLADMRRLCFEFVGVDGRSDDVASHP
jgi:hypothetical protein